MRQKAKRNFVHFITSDKFIQAVMTSSAFAIVSKGVETLGIVLNSTFLVHLGAKIPIPMFAFLSMMVIFPMAHWADSNTEEWREMVSENMSEESNE